MGAAILVNVASERCLLLDLRKACSRISNGVGKQLGTISSTKPGENMKKILSVCAIFVLGSTLALAQSKDQPTTATPDNRATAPNGARYDDTSPRHRDQNWGWIGLLGLAGLAGLRRRGHEADTTRHPESNLRRVA